LLDNGAEVEWVTEKGWTPLQSACHDGRVAVATLLLDYGAAINGWDKDGLTPLYFASRNGHYDVARLLLDNCAVVNTARWYWPPQPPLRIKLGWRPLHAASFYGHDHVVRLLLEKGAEVDPVDEDDDTTPLFLACEKGHIDVVRLLLDKGASEYSVNKYGQTPISRAQRREDYIIIELNTPSDWRRDLRQSRWHKGLGMPNWRHGDWLEAPLVAPPHDPAEAEARVRADNTRRQQTRR